MYPFGVGVTKVLMQVSRIQMSGIGTGLALC